MQARIFCPDRRGPSRVFQFQHKARTGPEFTSSVIAMDDLKEHDRTSQGSEERNQ